MSDLVPLGDAPARANWGRWVSDCSGPHCRNAWQVQPGDDAWHCNTCGADNAITWPADPFAIEYLLGLRPDPITRNWHPGEGLSDLLAENAAHGILPEGVAELTRDGASQPGGEVLMLTIEERVTGGLILPAVEAVERRHYVTRGLVPPDRLSLTSGEI